MQSCLPCWEQYSICQMCWLIYKGRQLAIGNKSWGCFNSNKSY